MAALHCFRHIGAWLDARWNHRRDQSYSKLARRRSCDEAMLDGIIVEIDSPGPPGTSAILDESNARWDHRRDLFQAVRLNLYLNTTKAMLDGIIVETSRRGHVAFGGR